MGRLIYIKAKQKFTSLCVCISWDGLALYAQGLEVASMLGPGSSYLAPSAQGQLRRINMYQRYAKWIYVYMSDHTFLIKIFGCSWRIRFVFIRKFVFFLGFTGISSF